MESAEVAVGVASSTEGDYGCVENHHDKKKKFKPLQKFRNFFRSSNKKRFKLGDGVLKSQSTGALHHKLEDIDSDDGGFVQTFSGHPGSRSISEDSVFKTDSKESAKIGVLKGHAVSMENVSKDVKPVLPRSVDSHESLVNVDGSDEDMFSSGVESGKIGKSVRSVSLDNLQAAVMNVNDFDVEICTAALNNEAAKHRISIKPKARKMSKKIKERSSTSSPLPDVTEESPIKLQHTKEEHECTLHRMIISTSIPVGDTSDTSVFTMPKSGPQDIQTNLETSVLMHSEASDISQDSRTIEEIEKSRQGSVSPLSTSPVSAAMLHEVKLRPRSLSGRLDNVDVKKESVTEIDELANAFNRARRISRKFEDGSIDINASKVIVAKGPEREIENTMKIEITKTMQVDQEQLRSPTVAYSSKDTLLFTLGAASVNGIGFVLKKEPLHPGNKVPEILKIGIDTKTEAKEMQDSKYNLGVGNYENVEIGCKTKLSDNVTKDTNLNADKSAPQSSPLKLASPRDGYRLRRHMRSKTLPASKDKEEEFDTKSGLGSVGAADYENVISARCSSWTSWVTKNKHNNKGPVLKLELEQNKVDNKSGIEDEAKLEVKSKSHASDIEVQQKLADNTTVEQKISVDGGIHKQHSSVKSCFLSGIPYEKLISSKTETDVSISSAGKAILDKAIVQSVKSQVFSTTEQPSGKPTYTKATVSGSSSGTKSSIVNSTKAHIYTNKPPLPSGRPVFSINADKSGSQPIKPVLDHKMLKSAAASCGSDTSSVRSPSVTNKLNNDVCKPNESTVTIAQSSVRPVGTSTSVLKLSDSKKESFKKLEFNESLENETKDTESLVKCNAHDKPKTSFSTSCKHDAIPIVPAWKKALNLKKSSTSTVSDDQKANIEIIDKDVTDQQATQRKIEKKSQKDILNVVHDKCSGTAGSRSSKVLDMVKNFQNLQVT